MHSLNIDDNSMLMLSGIQHFVFCPRQWALIHIEQLWADNLHTIQGEIVHTHADDPFYRTKMREKRIVRRMNIASRELGVYGFADIVECVPSPEIPHRTICLHNEDGHWLPTPIEYKKGSPKQILCDILQVVAQAICLEEMFSITVPHGEIYYDTIRRRERFEITPDHRSRVADICSRMHALMDGGEVPLAEYSAKKCAKCSLIDLCMPLSKGNVSVKSYLEKNLYTDEETP